LKTHTIREQSNAEIQFIFTLYLHERWF